MRHEVSSTLTKKTNDVNLILEQLVGSKIYDYCRMCRSVQPLLIVEVSSVTQEQDIDQSLLSMLNDEI